MPTCSRARSPTSRPWSTTARSPCRKPRRWPASGPASVVIGIAGELVRGFTTTHTQERKRADAPINEAELQKLIDGVQREALREAERSITWETGLPQVDVRLVHAAVTSASIDGYTVTNPVGFQGRHVKISIFDALRTPRPSGSPGERRQRVRPGAARGGGRALRGRARAGHGAGPAGRGALHRRGRRNEPTSPSCAQAASRARGCSLWAGRAFTKSLADRLDLPFPRAEALKIGLRSGPAGRPTSGDRRRSSPTT